MSIYAKMGPAQRHVDGTPAELLIRMDCRFRRHFNHPAEMFLIGPIRGHVCIERHQTFEVKG